MAFKAAIERLFRLLLIAVLACVVYILAYAIFTAVREFVLAIPVAAGIVFAFLKSNPVILVVCAACIFFAAIFYDRIKLAIARHRKANQENKD